MEEIKRGDILQPYETTSDRKYGIFVVYTREDVPLINIDYPKMPSRRPN